MAKGKHSVNGRDSAGKRLGVKVTKGQQVTAGQILVRQRGTKIFPGRNTGIGSDYTIFAKISGIVNFEFIRKGKKQLSVYPLNVRPYDPTTQQPNDPITQQPNNPIPQ